MIRKFGVGVMGKGLKIKDGDFINLSSIERWSCSNNEIRIYYATENSLTISNSSNGFNDFNLFYVEDNEFHRIKREIEEYMGIV
jgi:hypothetical protein